MKTQRNNFQQKLPKIFQKFFQKNMLHIWLRGVIYDKSRIFPLYWDQGEMPAQSGVGVQTEGGAAMIGREALLEQYEEALFALLMESVAEAEGEKALAESRRLNESGEEIMPAETHRRCLRLIDQKMAGRNVRQFGRGFVRAAGMAATIALVAIMVFTTAFAAQESFQAKKPTFGYAMKFHKHTTVISLPASSAALGSGQRSPAPQFSVDWLPKGFEPEKEEKSDSNVWIQYRRPNTEARIVIAARNLLDGSANVNTEDARVSYRQLRGTEAMVVETPDSVCQILWAAEGKGDWLFCAVGQNVELKTLLRVVESMVVE